MELIDGNAHVSRLVRAAVDVPVVLRQQVNVVEHCKTHSTLHISLYSPAQTQAWACLF